MVTILLVDYFNVVKEWSIDGYGLPDLGGNS